MHNTAHHTKPTSEDNGRIFGESSVVVEVDAIRSGAHGHIGVQLCQAGGTRLGPGALVRHILCGDIKLRGEIGELSHRVVVNLRCIVHCNMDMGRCVRGKQSKHDRS